MFVFPYTHFIISNEFTIFVLSFAHLIIYSYFDVQTHFRYTSFFLCILFTKTLLNSRFLFPVTPNIRILVHNDKYHPFIENILRPINLYIVIQNCRFVIYIEMQYYILISFRTKHKILFQSNHHQFE